MGSGMGSGMGSRMANGNGFLLLKIWGNCLTLLIISWILKDWNGRAKLVGISGMTPFFCKRRFYKDVISPRSFSFFGFREQIFQRSAVVKAKGRFYVYIRYGSLWQLCSLDPEALLSKAEM